MLRQVGGHDDRLDEAEALMREDLRASIRAHGRGHTDTLASLSNLAQLLCTRDE